MSCLSFSINVTKLTCDFYYKQSIDVGKLISKILNLSSLGTNSGQESIDDLIPCIESQIAMKYDDIYIYCTTLTSTNLDIYN